VSGVLLGLARQLVRKGGLFFVGSVGSTLVVCAKIRLLLVAEDGFLQDAHLAFFLLSGGRLFLGRLQTEELKLLRRDGLLALAVKLRSYLLTDGYCSNVGIVYYVFNLPFINMGGLQVGRSRRYLADLGLVLEQ